LSQANLFLNHTLSHAYILRDHESIGEAHLFQAILFYQSGKINLSISSFQQSHKLIKKIDLWQLFLIEYSKVLFKKNKKSDELTSIVEKMREVLKDILLELERKKEGEDRLKYDGKRLEIK
jgi:hypothetical protein